MNLLSLYEYNLFTHEQYLYSKVINIFTVYFLLVYPSIHLINLYSNYKNYNPYKKRTKPSWAQSSDYSDYNNINP